MRSISTTALRAQLASVLVAVLDGETLTIKRGNNTVAYLVSPRDWDEINGLPLQTVMEATGMSAGTALNWTNTLINEWGQRRVVARADQNPEEIILVRAAAEELVSRHRRLTAQSAQERTEQAGLPQRSGERTDRAGEDEGGSSVPTGPIAYLRRRHAG